MSRSNSRHRPKAATSVAASPEAEPAAMLPINVTVLVLGDLGRSPRMQYHTGLAPGAAARAPRRPGRLRRLGAHMRRCAPNSPHATRASLFTQCRPCDRPLFASRSLFFPRFSPHPSAARSLRARVVASRWVQRYFVTRAAYKLARAVRHAALLCSAVRRPAAARRCSCRRRRPFRRCCSSGSSALLRRARMVVDWHNYGFSLLQVGLVAARQGAVERRRQRASSWPSRTPTRAPSAASRTPTSASRTPWRATCSGALARVSANVLHDAPPPRFKPLLARRPQRRAPRVRRQAPPAAARRLDLAARRARLLHLVGRRRGLLGAARRRCPVRPARRHFDRRRSALARTSSGRAAAASRARSRVHAVTAGAAVREYPDVVVDHHGPRRPPARVHGALRRAPPAPRGRCARSGSRPTTILACWRPPTSASASTTRARASTCR
jgi:hypothetical protein